MGREPNTEEAGVHENEGGYPRLNGTIDRVLGHRWKSGIYRPADNGVTYAFDITKIGCAEDPDRIAGLAGGPLAVRTGRTCPKSKPSRTLLSRGPELLP